MLFMIANIKTLIYNKCTRGIYMENDKVLSPEAIKRLVVYAFDSSNAYTKAVKNEDPRERQDRIAQAIRRVQINEGRVIETEESTFVR